MVLAARAVLVEVSHLCLCTNQLVNRAVQIFRAAEQPDQTSEFVPFPAPSTPLNGHIILGNVVNTGCQVPDLPLQTKIAGIVADRNTDAQLVTGTLKGTSVEDLIDSKWEEGDPKWLIVDYTCLVLLPDSVISSDDLCAVLGSAYEALLCNEIALKCRPSEVVCLIGASFTDVAMLLQWLLPLEVFLYVLLQEVTSLDSLEARGNHSFFRRNKCWMKNVAFLTWETQSPWNLSDKLMHQSDGMGVNAIYVTGAASYALAQQRESDLLRSLLISLAPCGRIVLGSYSSQVEAIESRALCLKSGALVFFSPSSENSAAIHGTCLSALSEVLSSAALNKLWVPSSDDILVAPLSTIRETLELASQGESRFVILSDSAK